jgi:hypothetical protein
MKTLALTFGFIAVAALVAGFSGPADASQSAKKAPTVQVDAQHFQECALPSVEEDLQPMSTCFMCSSDSSGACSGAQQCRGTRKECRDKGCKITGTSSCSTAANVKKC